MTADFRAPVSFYDPTDDPPMVCECGHDAEFHFDPGTCDGPECRCIEFIEREPDPDDLADARRERAVGE